MVAAVTASLPYLPLKMMVWDEKSPGSAQPQLAASASLSLAPEGRRVCLGSRFLFSPEAEAISSGSEQRWEPEGRHRRAQHACACCHS